MIWCRAALALTLIAFAAPGLAQNKRRKKPKAVETPAVVDTEVIPAPDETAVDSTATPSDTPQVDAAEPASEEKLKREPKRKRKKKKSDAPPEPIVTSAALSGRVGSESIYFLDAERLRHQRLELNLKQTASFGDTIKTTVEGRFRADAAVYGEGGTYEHLSKPVRDDELAEAELRQAFFDGMWGNLRVKVGIQQIDWVESLSPKTSDVITPLDLRFGGFGAANEIIEPVFAINANRSAPLGALEWLIVPSPKMHRLAEGENGYGYSNLLSSIAGSNAVVTRELPKKHVDELEYGARYLMYFDSWDATLLAYHGHQRSPAMRIFPLSLTQNMLLQDHPQANTYGLSVSSSSDAFVGRLFAYYEPNRRPGVEFFAAPAVDPDDVERSSEHRTRIGFGADYVHSKHFKIYTESMWTETRYLASESPTRIVPARLNQADYVSSFRITNESYADWLFSLEGSFFSPKKAHILSPEIQYTFKGSYRAALGARFIRSFADDAPLNSLKDSSQAYLALQRLFNVQ